MGKADKRARKRENQALARAATAVRTKRQNRLSVAKRLVTIFAIIGLAFGVAWIANKDDASETDIATDTTEPSASTVPSGGPTATIDTNFGVIEVELDTANAPIASGQFIKLANEKFYDGLTFHRVIEDFMIQGGDPEGTGMGGSGTSVPGEVPADGYKIGSLAAAKSGADPAGTFDSQFFIVTGAQGVGLPPEYARFGIVTSGIEVALEIAKLQDAPGDTPKETVTINSITITSADAPTSTTAGS